MRPATIAAVQSSQRNAKLEPYPSRPRPVHRSSSVVRDELRFSEVMARIRAEVPPTPAPEPALGPGPISRAWAWLKQKLCFRMPAMD
jgi:hypothetical protein